MEEVKSKRFQLNKQDLTKVGKGAIIAISGALLTYLTEILPNIDVGVYAPLVTAIWGVLVNLGWKWIKKNEN